MRGRLASTLLALAVAAILVASANAALQWKVIASRKASGDFAVAVAGGNTQHPHAIAARILATPNQRVTGAWTIVCSKSLGAGSKHGTLAGTTPLLKVMRFPMSNPDNCTASASAQLRGSGTIRVQVVKR